MSYYARHIFMCTNQREGDKKCCNQANATALCLYAKAKIKALALDGKHKVRVSFSGCLGRCAEGPILVVYPEGVWYTYHKEEDIDDIISQHILQNKIVKNLLLSD